MPFRTSRRQALPILLLLLLLPPLALCLGSGAAGAEKTKEPASQRRSFGGGAASVRSTPVPESASLEMNGMVRSYLLQRPLQAGPGPHPLVLMLHGGTQTAAQIWRQTSLPAVAGRAGALVVAPQGLGKHWNDGRGATIAGDAASTADDVGFLLALIDQLVAQEQADPRAVFVFGVSNGGFMAMRLACEAGERLRAVATGLATLSEPQAAACPSQARLPWLLVHGTEDPIVPFTGSPTGAPTGAPAAAPRRKLLMPSSPATPPTRSAAETFRFWADRAGCGPLSAGEALSRPEDDARGRWAEAFTRADCSGGQPSRLVVLHGSGHVFPGLPIESRLVERIVGPGAPELDGGALVWAHFEHQLPR